MKVSSQLKGGIYEYEASFGYNTNLSGYCKKQMVGFFDYIRDTFFQENVP